MTMLQPRLLKVSAVLLALALPCGFAGHSAFAQVKKEAPGKEQPPREPAPADKPVTPEQFAAILNDDIAKWAHIVKVSGAKAE